MEQQRSREVTGGGAGGVSPAVEDRTTVGDIL